MAIQDSGYIASNGVLTSLVSGRDASSTYVHMIGTGSVVVRPANEANSGKIVMSGSLGTSVVEQVLVTGSVLPILGELTASVVTVTRCSDLVLDMDLGFIYSDKCDTKGNSMELKRYRGDTYPVTCNLSQNGNTDITGQTFKMSMQIDAGTIYTVDGTVINAPMGMVTFVPNILAIQQAGSGYYDVQGNDGTYIYTYEKGILTILDDLTV